MRNAVQERATDAGGKVGRGPVVDRADGRRLSRAQVGKRGERELDPGPICQELRVKFKSPWGEIQLPSEIRKRSREAGGRSW